jgi:hypothetical protein
MALERTDASGESIASNIRVKFLRSALQFLVTAKVPGLLILVTLTMEGIRSSGKSVLTRATQHHIPEDGIPQSPPSKPKS